MVRADSRRSDVTKLIGAFRNFASAPKKHLALIGAEFYGSEFALGL